LFDKEKKEVKYDLQSLDDIYKYSEQIVETVANY